MSSNLNDFSCAIIENELHGFTGEFSSKVLNSFTVRDFIPKCNPLSKNMGQKMGAYCINYL